MKGKTLLYENVVSLHAITILYQYIRYIEQLFNALPYAVVLFCTLQQALKLLSITSKGLLRENSKQSRWKYIAMERS